MHYTIRAFEQEAIDRLGQLYAPSEIREITRQLLEEVLACSRTQLLLLNKDKELPSSGLERLQHYLSALEQGHPLQYLLGYSFFAGHRLHVREGVLIPRPETEELVQLILTDPASQGSKHLLDIGTGSGCIAYALTAGLPSLASSTAIEVSSQAIPTAQANFNQLTQTTGRQVKLWKQDLFALVQGESSPEVPFDLIVSNPPYIHPDEALEMSPNVLFFEPHLALFAPENLPISYYSAIGQLLQQGYLAPGGQLWLELNPLYAEETLQELLSMVGEQHAHAELITDLSGKQRFLHLSYRPQDAQ